MAPLRSKHLDTSRAGAQILHFGQITNEAHLNLGHA